MVVAIALFASFAAGAAIGAVTTGVVDIHRTARRGGLRMPPASLAGVGARHLSGLNARSGSGTPERDPASDGRPSWPAW